MLKKKKTPPSRSTKKEEPRQQFAKSKLVHNCISHAWGGEMGGCVIRLRPWPPSFPLPPPPQSPHFLPVTPPSSLPDPYQTSSPNSGALRWPIGPWLCGEMSPAWGPQRAVSCAPPLRWPQLDGSSRVTPVKHSLDC